MFSLNNVDLRCRYWQEKGFAAIVASRILNLGALAFTIVMATFLLLLFDRQGLKAPCLLEETCDIATVAVKLPLSGETPLALLLKLIFLGMFSLYWLYSAINSAVEIWCVLPLSCSGVRARCTGLQPDDGLTSHGKRCGSAHRCHMPSLHGSTVSQSWASLHL